MSHPYADTSIQLCGLRWLGGDDIMERRLLGALVLTLLELRNFSKLIKNKATVGATGYVYYIRLSMLHPSKKVCVYSHSCIYAYRRGVCVARFDELGNAKALKE